jgi:hypothetical protein
MAVAQIARQTWFVAWRFQGQRLSKGQMRALTLQDRPLIAAVVNAIKEIAAITGAFRDHPIASLTDAQNGNDKLFANEIIATNVSADTITASSSMSAPTGTFGLAVHDRRAIQPSSRYGSTRRHSGPRGGRWSVG